MTTEKLIFTDELVAHARAQPEDRRRLIHRWAVFSGPGRENARHQLEAATHLIPVGQRPRVIGPLYSDDDKKVMSTTGVLLLWKVLVDLGWHVEHEPNISGVTPDLRVQKRGADFLIEVRHVAGDSVLSSAYQRLQASLRDIRTKTPVTFHTIRIDGDASLRRFRVFLRRALDEHRPGRQVYEERGVLLCFELAPPLDCEVDIPTFYIPDAFWFDNRPAVRAALDEKLKKYPFPLIIALQGIDTMDLLGAAEEVLLGSEVIQIPISHTTGGPAGPARLGRMRDSAALRRDADGARVRARLTALLPFELEVTDRGFSVRARLLANPAKPNATGIEEFRPIPTLLHLDSGGMAYVGADGQPVNRESIADRFVPSWPSNET